MEWRKEHLVYITRALLVLTMSLLPPQKGWNINSSTLKLHMCAEAPASFKTSITSAQIPPHITSPYSPNSSESSSTDLLWTHSRGYAKQKMVYIHTLLPSLWSVLKAGICDTVTAERQSTPKLQRKNPPTKLTWTFRLTRKPLGPLVPVGPVAPGGPW